MNSREIELVLKARLEASDAANDATAFATQIGQAMQTAFEGLGTTLADKFAQEFKARISQLDLDLTGFAGKGGGQGSGLMQGTQPALAGQVDTSRPITSESNSGQIHQRIVNFGGGSTDSFSDPFGRLDRGRSGMISQFTAGWENVRGAKADWIRGVGEDHINSMDDKIDTLRTYAKVKKIAPHVNMGEFGINEAEIPNMKKDLQAMAVNAAKTATSPELKEELRALTGAMKDLHEDYKTARSKPVDERSVGDLLAMEEFEAKGTRKNGIETLQRNAQDVMDRTGQAVKDLPDAAPGAMPWYRDAQKMGAVSKGMILAGQVGQFASELPYLQGRNAAAGVEINNMGARDFMRGDYSSLIGAQMAGGYDQLKSNSTFSTALGIGSQAVVGIGSMIGGAFASSTGVGAAFGAPLMLAGGGLAMDAGRNAVNFDSARQAKMRDQISSTVGANQEMIDTYMQGRTNSMSAYGDAKAMGSSAYSQFLSGFSKDLDPHKSVFVRSANSGLSMNEMSQGLRSYARGMGGTVDGVNVLDGMTDEIARGNKFKGLGFHNIEDVSAGFFAGGSTGGARESRANAMNFAQDSYASMKVGGLDEAASVGLLTSQGQRAGSSLDAAAGAKYATDNVSSYVASGASGMNLNNQYGMSAMSRGESNLQSGMVTSNGMMGIARIRAIEDLEKKLGRKLTRAERFEIGTGAVGEQWMQKAMAGSKTKLSASELTKGFIDDNRREAVDMYTRSNGGDRDLGKSMVGKNVMGGADALETHLFGDMADRPGGKLRKATKSEVDGMKRDDLGKPETEQDTKMTLRELFVGMKNAKEGFNAVATSAGAAAKRLAQIAGTKIASEAEFKKMNNDAAKEQMSRGINSPSDFVVGAYKWMTSNAHLSPEEQQERINEMRKASAPKNSKGTNHE